MRASVNDVHHRDGEAGAAHPAKEPVEGDAQRFRRRVAAGL